MGYGDLLIYFLYFVIPLLIFYLYGTRNNNYWKEKGIPYIKPNFLLGNFNIFNFTKEPLHVFDAKWYKKLGQIFGGFEGTTPYLFIGDPELIREISIKDFQTFPSRRRINTSDEIFTNMVASAVGEKWKKLRAAISPTFSSGKLRLMSKLIDECAESAVLNLREASSKDGVDVKGLFGAFTMDAIAITAFGLKINSHKHPNNPFVKNAYIAFNQNFSYKFLLFFLFPSLGKLMGKLFINAKTSDFFKEAAKKAIEERKKSSKDSKRVDFLQIMLDANIENVKNDESNKGLTEAEIISQCILFFVAGYGTTSAALAYTVYNLAQNPEYQDRLAEEINSVLKETNGVIEYDTLKKMTFLEAVISEILRLYPPGSRIERQAAADYRSKKLPFTIPKGMIIGFPAYSVHRDPKYFPNPEKFDPDRFMPENKDSLNLDAYMPFGNGPRNCIAMRFALDEMKHCLAKIIPKFRFSFCKETKVPLEFYATFGGLMPKDIFLKVDIRN